MRAVATTPPCTLPLEITCVLKKMVARSLYCPGAGQPKLTKLPEWVLSTRGHTPPLLSGGGQGWHGVISGSMKDSVLVMSAAAAASHSRPRVPYGSSTAPHRRFQRGWFGWLGWLGWLWGGLGYGFGGVQGYNRQWR